MYVGLKLTVLSISLLAAKEFSISIYLGVYTQTGNFTFLSLNWYEMSVTYKLHPGQIYMAKNYR